MSYIPNSFDEAYYLAQNPDVAAAVAAGVFTSGLQHYEISGAHELRNPNAYFDEQYYLFTNPDVAAAVASGIFSSGLEHFEKYGKSEDRAPKAGVAFDEAAYLAAWPDVAAAVHAGLYASGWDHYVAAGAAEGRTAVPPSTGEITSTVSGSVTTLSLDSDSGAVDLTASKLSVDGGAGLSTLHLTGDADVRIDFTNPNNQLRGIDLNTDGTIAANGIENNVSGAGIVTVKNFEIVDAYARDPLNETDHTANFAGAISYDGTGFAGDGVSTDGNIFLGGLGADKAFGGIGNDFLAGGGVGSSIWEQNALTGAWVNSITGAVVAARPVDALNGGRNADFMFAELSALDNTDGNNTRFDGGTTADDSAAGAGDSGQDTDWLLLEASDDNEPVTVNLGTGFITLGDNSIAATLVDVENLDASGNLYGFLNDVDVELGGRRVDDRSAAPVVGTENYGIGSTGQLNVVGSGDANRIIGGYDNDAISGGGGNDLLIGGNLAFLQANRNNPNLIDANGGLDLNVHTVGGKQLVNDGTDLLVGGDGADNLVFEMDGGTYEGGSLSGTTGNPTLAGERDTLWITNFSAGRLAGHTQAEEVADPLASQSDALAAQTKDSTIRLDLGVGHGDLFRGYGGADVLNNQINGQSFTADQSQYNAGGVRTTVQDISDVITTGLGAVDYFAAGTNNPDLTFNNLQNRLGINADLDLRGIKADSNANTLGRQFADGVWADKNFGYNTDGTLATDWDEGDNTLYANTGDDKVEGRTGDDLLSGGTGDDDFFTTQADGTDLIHRQQDANGDNVWDTDAAGNGLFVQDFRAPQAGDITSSRLTIDFGTTDLTSVNVAVTQVNLVIGGSTFAANIALGTHGIDDIAAAVNTAYQAIDADVSVVAVNNALVVTDKQGRDISDEVSEGYVVAGAVANGSLSTTAVFAPGGTPINIVEDDRLIYTAYLDRANNVLVNDAKNSLDTAPEGGGGYASDLVVGFGADGTTLAASQEWRIQFQNLGEGDTVTVTVNGTSYERTFSKATDGDTDGFVANLRDQINSTAQDLNTAAGTLSAAQDDVILGSTDERVLVLTNASVFGDAAVFMDKPEVTVVSSSGATAAVALANTSASSIELFGFDGRNNALNADDVLFVGQTAQKNGYTAANSRAVLATALTTGGELTGSAALVVKNAGLHGDDQLIGGDGNDIIKGLTGDDRIIGSKGTDTVDGGGNDVGTDGVTPIAYNDVLLFQEGDFGAGAKFTVTLDATLAANTNKGVVTAVDDKGAVLGTTTYTGIELVRTLSNTAADTLNVQALSDAIVTKSGVSLEASEGIDIQLTEGAAGLVTVTVDNNNDGAIVPSEVFTVGRVLGAESIVSGKSNDSVTMDDSQLGSTNNLDLGGETSDTVPVNTFIEGADTAIYQTKLTGADAYTTTVMVGSTADTVAMTGGVLGDKVVTDTLTNVEVLDVDDLNDDANPNSGAFNADVLNLTNFATTGATVNYGDALKVGKSLGGELGATSVANVEANTLEAGGVSQTGTGLGNELLEVVGITRLEQVIGSDGADRVIVGDTMESGRIVRDILDNPAVVDVFDIGTTTYLGNAELDVQDKGLYQFKLGSGNDVLDYDDETQDVGVLVGTSSTSSTDWVLVGSGDLDAVGERIDYATDVERYFGGAGKNTIDLSQATVDTTVQFSKESLLSSNQYADPDGLANGKSLTVDDIVRGNEVRGTADGTVFATFMDRTTNAVAGDSFWTNVVGNKQAETILLTNNEAATAQTFTLNGGANVVDYSARTAAISAFIGAVDTSDTDTSGKFTLAGDSAAQTVFTTDNDLIDITRGTSFGSGTLKVIGSGQDHDVVNITALFAVDKDSFNIVDLAVGTVTEDRNDAATGNFVTQISGFEDITGSSAADRLIGSGSANLIIAGLGADGVNGGKGADQIVFGGIDGSVDRLYYTATDAGNTADGTIVNSADRVTGFWLPDGDQLVFDTTLLSTINQLGNVKVAAAGAFAAATDGVLVSTTTTGAASFTAGSTVSLAELQTAFGAIGGSSANKEYVLIAKDTGGESGVFHFKDVDGNGTIDAGDVVTLLSVIDDTDYSAAPTAVVTRQGAAAGSQTINGANNGGTMEVVYSAQNQSTLAARDTIDAFNIGADGPATVDKLDLSQLHLGLSSGDAGFVDKGTYDANGIKTADAADGIDDAIQAVKFRSGVSVDGADTLTDFFNDAAATTAAGTNVDRAVFVQQEAATNAFRVFVDVNRDGDFTQGADMVIDLTNVVDVGNNFNALVPEATGIAEFIGAIRFTEIA